MDPNHPLLGLARELAAPTTPGEPSSRPRLSIVSTGDLLHVDFYGAPFEEAFETVCTALNKDDVAPVLASVSFRCPDQGMNGTCSFGLEAFVNRRSKFPALRSLSLQQNIPATHNRIVIGEDDEGGILGTLLKAAPALESLVAPSAPDRSFFELSNQPLKYLNVDSGYATQNFIANLAESSSFPMLEHLEFGEYNETYMEDFASHCTPEADYRRLFTSPAFGRVQFFRWRNPVLSREQIAELRALCPQKGLQFQVIRSSAEYV
jgi:hypothetical protein